MTRVLELPLNLGDHLQRRPRKGNGSESRRECLGPSRAWYNGWVNYGLSLEANQRFDEAETAYKKAIAQDSKFGKAHLLLGDLQMRRGRPSDALATLKNLALLWPNEAHARHDLGVVMIKTGNPTDGQAELEQAVRLMPRTAMFWANLGLVRYQRRSLAGSIEACRAALCFQPDNLAAIAVLSDALAEAGDLECAVSTLRAGVAALPNNFLLRFNLGHRLHETGRYDEAAVEFEQALRIQPNDVRAIVRIGEILMRRQDLSKAESLFRAALAQDPRSSTHAANLGEVVAARYRFSEASAMLERGIELAPEAEKRQLQTQLDKVNAFIAWDRAPQAALNADVARLDRLAILRLAEYAEIRREWAAAARFYAAAAVKPRTQPDDPLKRDPVDLLTAVNSVDAAQTARPPLDDRSRSELLDQAHRHLRALLDQTNQRFDEEPLTRAAQTRLALRELRDSARLAPIREEKRLSTLPKEEQTRFRRFWVDVETLWRRAGGR